jgi:hypothetical protein
MQHENATARCGGIVIQGAMTFLRIVIPLCLLFEHDLRAIAFRDGPEEEAVSTLADHAPGECAGQ